MSALELLTWARGTGLQLAVAVFLLGMTARVIEMWLLGRRPDHSTARPGTGGGGLHTLWYRFWPRREAVATAPVVVVGGYVFHVAFFVVLLLYAPHVLLFRQWFGVGWPALPAAFIDAVTVAGMLALAALLIHRVWHPVRRLLSTFQDYVVWAVSAAPFVTGYLADHGLVLDYTTMLALHVLSVDLLLVVAPFTRLAHMLSFVWSRWYTGQMSGRRGVRI